MEWSAMSERDTSLKCSKLAIRLNGRANDLDMVAKAPDGRSHDKTGRAGDVCIMSVEIEQKFFR